MNKELFRETLYSGVWGTCGPHFEQFSAQLARQSGGAYGVAMHSASAALETALRAAGVAHGDAVLLAARCDRADVDVTVAAGAIPVFADVTAQGILTAEAVSAACAAGVSHGAEPAVCGIKAVILDHGDAAQLAAVSRVCAAAGVRLLVNAFCSLGAVLPFDGVFAAVFDLGHFGCAVTGSEQAYTSVFAWHHCGHAPGTAASITFEEIVGGDTRITEFHAIEGYDVLAEAHTETPLLRRGYIFAPGCALLASPYFRKCTGFTGRYRAADHPVAAGLCAFPL